MPSEDERQRAYAAGQQAYRDGKHPFANPNLPIPPGELLLARLWRAGWWAAQRKDQEK